MCHSSAGAFLAGQRRTQQAWRRRSAGTAAVIAGLVLLGWAFNIEPLKRIVPGLVAMNPVTAVAFLLCALSLWLFRSEHAGTARAGEWALKQGCALLAALIGLARFVAVCGGPDLHVDQWLFGAKLTAGFTLTNTMAPNTALNLILIGCGLLFLHNRRRRVSGWASAFAIVSGFGSLLALIGYSYGIKSFYNVGAFVPMSLPTAVTFFVLAIGILAAQGDRGIVAIVTGPTAGGTMARRLLPAAIFLPALLGWLRLEGQRRDLYDAEFGIALYTVTSMFVFAALVCCNARLLFRSDATRRRAERQVRRSNDELELRVRERTEELSGANAALQTAHAEMEARVRERTALLAETEGRLHAIVDNTNSLIVVKDLEGRYVLVNQRFAALVGRSKEEIIGRSVHDFFPAETAKKCREHDALALRSENSFEVQETIVQDGRAHSFIANKFPLRDAAGNIYAICDVSTDITGLKHLERALVESKQQLERAMQANQLMMDNSQDVICSIDEEGRFASVSAASEKLWGYTPEELVGRKYIDLVKPEDREKTNAAAAAIVGGLSVSDFENCYRRKDGSFVDVMWSAHWSETEKRMFCVARDVTARARAERALRRATDEANRANRAKSEFLSRMSHELRTPMNAILGFAQLLELDDLNADQREGVSHILRGGRHLLELINEVLDISRIEAGALSLSPEPVEIAHAIKDTLAMVQPLAAAREVRVYPLTECFSYVQADRQRLKQVLINLLSNAIKYNRIGGSVTVRCELIDDRARILISDTGIGVPAEHLEALFVPFERLGAEQSTIEGTGLGLAVAKRLVEAMGGTIGVESVAGQGSTFWVEFALTQSPLESAAFDDAGADPPAAASPTSRKVLYIEDNLSNVELIARLIQRRPGVELLTAGEGAAGVSIAREQRPDVILLDVNLPDINGHEVLARLRAEPAVAEIPVVVISADATRGQINRLLRGGAVEYLTKPLAIREFLNVLDRIFASKSTAP